MTMTSNLRTRAVLATGRSRVGVALGIVVLALATGAAVGGAVARRSADPVLLADAEARLQAPDACERVTAGTKRCAAFSAVYVLRPLTEPHACRDEGGAPDGTWQQRFFGSPSLCRWTRDVDGRRVEFTGDQAVGYLPLTNPPTAAAAGMRAWAADLEHHRTHRLPGLPAPKETAR